MATATNCGYNEKQTELDLKLCSSRPGQKVQLSHARKQKLIKPRAQYGRGEAKKSHLSQYAYKLPFSLAGHMVFKLSIAYLMTHPSYKKMQKLLYFMDITESKFNS